MPKLLYRSIQSKNNGNTPPWTLHSAPFASRHRVCGNVEESGGVRLTTACSGVAEGEGLLYVMSGVSNAALEDARSFSSLKCSAVTIVSRARPGNSLDMAKRAASAGIDHLVVTVQDLPVSAKRARFAKWVLASENRAISASVRRFCIWAGPSDISMHGGMPNFGNWAHVHKPVRQHSMSPRSSGAVSASPELESDFCRTAQVLARHAFIKGLSQSRRFIACSKRGEGPTG